MEDTYDGDGPGIFTLDGWAVGGIHLVVVGGGGGGGGAGTSGASLSPELVS